MKRGQDKGGCGGCLCDHWGCFKGRGVADGCQLDISDELETISPSSDQAEAEKVTSVIDQETDPHAF